MMNLVPDLFSQRELADKGGAIRTKLCVALQSLSILEGTQMPLSLQVPI